MTDYRINITVQFLTHADDDLEALANASKYFKKKYKGEFPYTMALSMGNATRTATKRTGKALVRTGKGIGKMMGNIGKAMID